MRTTHDVSLDSHSAQRSLPSRCRTAAHRLNCSPLDVVTVPIANMPATALVPRRAEVAEGLRRPRTAICERHLPIHAHLRRSAACSACAGAKMQMATEVPPWKIACICSIIKIRIRREWSSLSFTFT